MSIKSACFSFALRVSKAVIDLFALLRCRSRSKACIRLTILGRSREMNSFTENVTAISYVLCLHILLGHKYHYMLKTHQDRYEVNPTPAPLPPSHTSVSLAWKRGVLPQPAALPEEYTQEDAAFDHRLNVERKTSIPGKLRINTYNRSDATVQTIARKRAF